MFEKLVGNQPIGEMFVRMLRAGRIPGAMLFTGEEGLGKQRFALELAKALNCLTPVHNQGCDNCPRCKRILKIDEKTEDDNITWSEFPDVGVIRPNGAFVKVGQIRNIEREANFRPFEGRARLLIIDEADRMNPNAANALLKTLEEPPSTTHLILITARPAQLVQTILSRCQLVRFSPLSADEISNYLVRERSYKSADAKVLSRISLGSLGRALSTNLDKYREQRDAMLELLMALTVEKDRVKLLKGSEQLNDARFKEEYEQRLDLLAGLIHDAWLIGLGSDPAEIANSEVGAKIKTAADSKSPKIFAAWLKGIDEHKRKFAVNINKKISTDALLLEMAAS